MKQPYFKKMKYSFQSVLALRIMLHLFPLIFKYFNVLSETSQFHEFK